MNPDLANSRPRTGGTMRELDKAAMGRRIRQIRLGANLRQWELARMLGTTQSAIHKYEHGVVPEPRRLMEVARIGETSVEWVLTGRHWDNGSRAQKRLSSAVLETASSLCTLRDDNLDRIDEALRIVNEAVRALDQQVDDAPRPEVIREGLNEHAAATLQLLESAWRIQRAVLRRVAQDTLRRLDDGGAPEASPGPAAGD